MLSLLAVTALPLQMICTAITVWLPFSRNTTISGRGATGMPIKSWQCQIKGTELSTAPWRRGEKISYLQCQSRALKDVLQTTWWALFKMHFLFPPPKIKKVFHPLRSATAFGVLTSYFSVFSCQCLSIANFPVAGFSCQLDRLWNPFKIGNMMKYAKCVKTIFPFQMLI